MEGKKLKHNTIFFITIKSALIFCEEFNDKIITEIREGN